MKTAKTNGTIRRVLPASAMMIVVSLVLGSFLGLGTLPATAAQDTSTNEEVVRRYFDELHTAGDLAVADEVVAQDAVFHTPDGDLQGVEGITGLVTLLRTAFPDAEFPIEDLVATEDRVVVRWTMIGTHEGEFAGIAPTGASVTMSGMALLTLEDGMIVENWIQYDRLGLLQQIGAFGATPEAVSDQPIAGCIQCMYP